MTPCPECIVGKHGNCDQWAWDFERDDRAPCPCWADVDRRYVIGAEVLVCSYCGALYTTSAEPTGPGQ